MKSEQLSFENASGHKLDGILYNPIGSKSKATALFAHCFTCNKNFKAVKNISRGLTSMGISVLVFDFTGLGASEGDFSDSTFRNNISDLIAAEEYLTKNYQSPQILIGHSLGGTAAMFSAKQMNAVKAVVTIGSPFEPEHVLNLFDESLEEIKSQGQAKVNIGGRKFNISKEFVEDVEGRQSSEIVQDLEKALLVMHSPQDEIVNIKNAAKIYEAAWHPKSFISLDGADHLLSSSKDSIYAGKVIAQWASKYIELPDDQKLESKSQVAASTTSEGYTTEIKAGPHYLTADESEEYGGQDLGPDPYELLSSALAACTTITLQMYAQRKEWKLEEVIVHINHEKKHIEDLDNLQKSKARIDHFEKKIELIGDLSDEQREKLLEISTKCPVHKTLSTESRISSDLI